MFRKLLFAIIALPLIGAEADKDFLENLSVSGLISGGVGLSLEYDLDEKSRLSTLILTEGNKYQDTISLGLGYVFILEQGTRYEVNVEPFLGMGYIMMDTSNTTYISSGLSLGFEYYFAPKKFSLGLQLGALANFGDIDEVTVGTAGAYARYHF